MEAETTTKYETVTTVYTPRQRRASAAKWILFGGALTLVLALCGLKDQSFYGGAVASAVVFGVIAFVAYMRTSETKLTPEAEVQQRQDELARERRTWAPVEKILEKRIVRYPLAALLLWWAYSMSQDPTAKPIHVIAPVVFAAFAAHDVARWLAKSILWVIVAGLAVGVVMLVVKGAAAMPVSVAIIIGALIIASAIKR